LENLASSRVQLFAIVKTTARKVLQHCIPHDGAFGFAGSEWNGHALGGASGFCAKAANAQ
jgi:hypothetical protein